MPSFPTRTEGPYHGRQRQHCHWSCPTRAEVPETWRKQRQQVLFFSRTHVSRNQKWAFCYISSLFQSARKPLTRLLEAQARRRLFQSTRPLSPLSICRPLRLRRTFPTCTEGGSQERQTGLVRRARKGSASASAVSAPSFYRLRLCLLYALRLPRAALFLCTAPLLGACSLLWAVAALPRLRASFPAFKEFPRSLPPKAAPATRRKKTQGIPARLPPAGWRAALMHLARTVSGPFPSRKKRPSSRRHALVVSSFPHFGRKYPGHAFFLLLPIPSFNKNPQKGRIYLF